MQKEFFSTSLEHILAELERIDLLIKLHVLEAQRVYQSKTEFQGLFISENEVERLLNQQIGRPIKLIERLMFPRQFDLFLKTTPRSLKKPKMLKGS